MSHVSGVAQAAVSSFRILAKHVVCRPSRGPGHRDIETGQASSQDVMAGDPGPPLRATSRFAPRGRSPSRQGADRASIP